AAQIPDVVEIPKVTESELQQRALATVKLAQKPNAINLQFPVKGKPRFAIWKRGHYIWVAIDTYTAFSVPSTDVIEDFKQIDSEVAIIRIFAPKFSYANPSFIAGFLNLELSNNPANNSISLPFETSENSIKFSKYFANAKVISFQDPEVGDEVRAVMTNTPGVFQTNPKSMLDFQVLPSFHGLGVILRADDVTIDPGQNDINITSHYEVPSPITALQTTPNNNPPTNGRNSPTKLSSMLPVITNDLILKSFPSMQSHLLRSLARSDDEWESYAGRLDLAQFYFMHGLYHESLAMLNIAHIINPKDYEKNVAILLQNAVTLTILGYYTEAKGIYNILDDLYNNAVPDEVSIYRNYNEYMLGNMPITIGFINSINQFINLYPEDLYWSLAFAEIDLCLQNNNLRTLESLFKSLRTPTKIQLVDSLKLYKASYYRKKNQSNIAKQLLGEILSQDKDPYNITRANIELIKLLSLTEETDAKGAIRELDKLRFSWRGDKVEFDLLLNIAELYKLANDPINAMRTYKYMISAFGQEIQYFYIVSEMVKIYNSIFLPGGSAEKMSDFDAVALFYEFRDTTPIGVDGDNVILMIARRLINLDLLDTASQLLKHQVEYRLSGDKRSINADHLALLYIMMEKPEEALKILNKTDNETKTIKEHIHREQLKAKALMDMGKYNDALVYLTEEDADPVSKTIKKEVYFKSKKWADYITYVKPDVDEALKTTISGNRTQDVLRLALSYSMLNNSQALEDLQAKLKTDNEQLKTAINFLAVTNQPVDHHNIDKSLHIDQMKQFLSNSKQELFK
ncbi:MAG: hypothetical protein V4485_05005, partial [Pseudomonadota bacterium]